MKSGTSLKHGLARVKREWLREDFGPALQEVERLLADYPDQPQLLSMRAALIQLQEDDGRHSLADAKRDLLRVVELQEDSPAALIELGYFLFAVENDARSAAKCFQKAAQLGRRLLKDALLGQAEALSELDRERQAEDCLVEALQVAAHNGKSGLRPILERLNTLQTAE